MTRGESKQHVTFHHHIVDVFKNNHLLVYDNCYGISCLSKDRMNRGICHTLSVLTRRCL